MDINIVRSIVTVISFVTFLGIVFWAYSPSRAGRFDDAARLPFREGDEPSGGTGQ